MAIVATGELAVTPDLKGFESRMGSSIGGLAKKAALAFGGAFAATKAVDFLTSSIADARESNAIAAQTAAVIKSTGGAAGVSAKQVDDLANSLSRKTAVDDEQIAKASNLLLTFTNIKNAAGANNDIFNQATAIAVDMGKALGTDAAGSAIQLGKALNDPVKGITALTRVGVTFTDQQKKQIEGFVKAGKVADAQKVILAELSKEFGGSAAAQATASERLKITFGNLKEDLGNKLIPVIDKVATFLANNLPAAMNAAGAAFGAISRFLAPVIANFMLFFNALRTGFTEDEGTGIESFALRVREVIQNLVEVLTKMFDFVMEHKEVLVGLAAAIVSALVPAFVAWATAAGAAAIATITAAAPVIAIGVAIGGLVAALVYAYKHWTLFHDVVNNVAGFITGTLVPVIGTIAGVIGRFITAYVKVMIAEFSTFKEVGVGAFNAVKATVQFFIDKIKTAYEWVAKLIEKIGHIPGAGVAKNVLHAVGVPGFAEGGVVPGPIGAPRLAVVHGGEEVLTPAQRGYGRGGPLVGQMIIQGATFEGANATAYAAVRELRAEAFRQGK